MKHGKKYIESAKSFDNKKLYDPEEGISQVAVTRIYQQHVRTLLVILAYPTVR